MLDEETSVCPVIRQEQSNVHNQLLDSKRFSKWSKLVRVAAYVRRMADIMKGERNFPEKLTPEEIKRAEMMIIRQAQEEKIDDETKKKWSLIMEDDVWKCQGRMQNMEEELRTLVADAEGIINSRPITQVADDSNEVLRPIDFLVPQVQMNILSDEGDNDEEYFVSKLSTKDNLKKRWHQTKMIINKFWEIWKTNYLAILRNRTQKEHKGPRSFISRPPRLHEIVLVAEENVPRGNWLLGRIIEIRMGAGNAIRTARVQMPNGNIWTRPLNHLCPLEADIQLSNETANHPPNADQDNPILHPQNEPNLDEEDEEMPENSSQPKQISKKTPTAANLVNAAVIKPVGKFWPIFFLLIAMTQLTTASMKMGSDCESSNYGAFMRFPKTRNCSTIGQQHDFVKKLIVTIHSRIPMKLSAGACSKIIRTVCTRSFLRWWLEVTMDETTIEPMKLEDCLAMNQNKRFNDVALLAVGENKWESQVPTHYSYATLENLQAVLSNGTIAQQKDEQYGGMLVQFKRNVHMKKLELTAL
ncbi:unnamed protein product [Anisakis simplex]|uniref:DUF5641 domain-containing protein n=1 Tax=Anisakis simplex TaxID=6269 RepID=A0A0M3J0J3_ANISI|nr:unnamed protein product [Anisakis simplex]